MLSVRTNRKPPPKPRAPASALAPLAEEHVRLRADNARLKAQNTQLKLALARAVLEKTRRRK